MALATISGQRSCTGQQAGVRTREGWVHPCSPLLSTALSTLPQAEDTPLREGPQSSGGAAAAPAGEGAGRDAADPSEQAIGDASPALGLFPFLCRVGGGGQMDCLLSPAKLLGFCSPGLSCRQNGLASAPSPEPGADPEPEDQG